MPNRPNRDTNESTDSIPPDHHHGGQELPDDVQDRPEQNAGYDAAVRGESGDNDDELDLTDIDEVLDNLDREDNADDEDITH